MFKKKLTEAEIDRFLDQYTIKPNHVIFRGIIQALNNGGYIHERTVRRFTKKQEAKAAAYAKAHPGKPNENPRF